MIFMWIYRLTHPSTSTTSHRQAHTHAYKMCISMWKIGENAKENQLTHHSAQQTNRNVCIGEAFVTNWLYAYKIVGCKGIVFWMWKGKYCDSISERWSIRFPHFGSLSHSLSLPRSLSLPFSLCCSKYTWRWKICDSVPFVLLLRLLIENPMLCGGSVHCAATPSHRIWWSRA